MASIMDTCYYDFSLHIDDDDMIYVVYGTNQAVIAELDIDGRS